MNGCPFRPIFRDEMAVSFRFRVLVATGKPILCYKKTSGHVSSFKEFNPKMQKTIKKLCITFLQKKPPRIPPFFSLLCHVIVFFPKISSLAALIGFSGVIGLVTTTAPSYGLNGLGNPSYLGGQAPPPLEAFPNFKTLRS